MKLLGKILIQGELITQTGLHVGGSKSSLAIGGIDNNVIMSALKQPYIPGSSIKGKLRSLLAKSEGSLFFNKDSKTRELKRVDRLLSSEKTRNKEEIQAYRDLVYSRASSDEDHEYIMELFGYSGDSTKTEQVSFNRLLVRDAFLINSEDRIFEEGYTDSKWENVINRRTGTAEHPRQMERVPAGAKFGFEIVYNIYDDATANKNAKLKKHLNQILLALQLMQDDGVGGQISRGYGKVKVNIQDAICKLINQETYAYETMERSTLIGEDSQQLLDNFKNEL